MKPTNQRTALKRAHWYRYYVGECPVCGRDAGWKERVYGAKPKRASRRYVLLAQTETYDHCLQY